MVDIDESNRELQIYVNRDIAAKMGLKVNDVARIINTSSLFLVLIREVIDGVQITRYQSS